MISVLEDLEIHLKCSKIFYLVLIISEFEANHLRSWRSDKNDKLNSSFHEKIRFSLNHQFSWQSKSNLVQQINGRVCSMCVNRKVLEQRYIFHPCFIQSQHHLIWARQIDGYPKEWTDNFFASNSAFCLVFFRQPIELQYILLLPFQSWFQKEKQEFIYKSWVLILNAFHQAMVS